MSMLIVKDIVGYKVEVGENLRKNIWAYTFFSVEKDVLTSRIWLFQTLDLQCSSVHILFLFVGTIKAGTQDYRDFSSYRENYCYINLAICFSRFILMLQIELWFSLICLKASVPVFQTWAAGPVGGGCAVHREERVAYPGGDPGHPGGRVHRVEVAAGGWIALCRDHGGRTHSTTMPWLLGQNVP